MPKQGAAASKFSCKALILAGTILGSGIPSEALAQVAGQAAPPPVRQSIDANGVDVSRGTFAAGLTTASCSGTADEAKTTVSYGPQTTGTANNLLPASTTAASGNGAISATVSFGYDSVGNTITVDGPLAGTADTTRYRYDADRQQVGVVSPDPDGGGSRTPVAQRYTYNGDGQLTLSELGTVVDQSDPAWANFTSAQQSQTTYSSARPSTMTYNALGRLLSEGQAFGSISYLYDAAGRTTQLTWGDGYYAAYGRLQCPK